MQCQLPRPSERLLVAFDVLVQFRVGHEDVLPFRDPLFPSVALLLAAPWRFWLQPRDIEGAGFFSLKCVSKGSAAMRADDVGTDKPLGSCVVPVMVATVVRVPAVRLAYTAWMGLESVVLCGDGRI